MPSIHFQSADQIYVYGHSSIDGIATKVNELERKAVRRKKAIGNKQPLFQSSRIEDEASKKL
ncbi:hypothetical protein P7K49_030168 [Saguinus oedipus]|uniref:Uncharacterized protein n=1 Tax=Saguinus oedipus TaxID=9490 RepID=A0ABQ9U1G5_SAGOE|nr:hypothetical protein P7K49_030168 [Saguinus oedipus]